MILALALFATGASVVRPNVVFIMTDDHAAHAISAYGSRLNQTPSLDRLASEGILFRNAFVTNSIDEQLPSGVYGTVAALRGR